jgi:hypothetical protein
MSTRSARLPRCEAGKTSFFPSDELRRPFVGAFPQNTKPATNSAIFRASSRKALRTSENYSVTTMVTVAICFTVPQVAVMVIV